MAFDYDRARATADRLIANFGREVTLSRPGATTGPGHNPTPGTPTLTTHQAAFIKDSLFNRANQVTLAGDRRLIMQAPAAGAPTTKDTIIDDGEDWSIVEVLEERAGPTLVYVELLVRQ